MVLKIVLPPRAARTYLHPSILWGLPSSPKTGRSLKTPVCCVKQVCHKKILILVANILKLEGEQDFGNTVFHTCRNHRPLISWDYKILEFLPTGSETLSTFFLFSTFFLIHLIKLNYISILFMHRVEHGPFHISLHLLYVTNKILELEATSEREVKS